MSATQERDQVSRIVGTDIDSALRIARKIGDPWFRCQALAHVAWHAAAPRRFFGLVAESLESGWSIKIPNRAVTVIAWPVAALARRQFPDAAAMKRNGRELRAVIDRLAKVIAGEPSPASRADALLMHVHALSPFRPELRNGVLGLLVKECQNPANRKRQRQVEEAALVVAPDDPARAIGLTALLEGTRKNRTIAKITNQSEVLGPKPFFDTSGTPGL
jgi:hypothetical protein